MKSSAYLIILILVGIISKSNIIATAACILLIINLINLSRLLPMIERRGLELGLLFLLLAVLVPFANGNLQLTDISKTITTLPGLLAIIGGVAATHMNGKGLLMLHQQPQLIIGIVIGAIIGIVFFDGVPIGPLMAAGIMALFADILKIKTRQKK